MYSESHTKPIRLFLSFDPKDRAFRDTMNTHLSSLHRTGVIDRWHEYEIPPGSEWQEVDDDLLHQADIVLLCITPDFIASNYLYSVQMKQAIEKHDAGEGRVIPVMFRPTVWYNLPFAKLQGLPLNEQGSLKPINEWENIDRAYVETVTGIQRVADELAGRSSQQSSPQEGGQTSLWSVPYLPYQYFTARHEILNNLYTLFQSARTTPITIQALSGPGGIGKTQIAITYAHQHRTEYEAIFWLKGDSPEDFFADVIQLAHLLKLPERKEPDQQIIIAAMKRYFSRADRWLLIIDNLENFELINKLVPTTGRGDILITTREQASGGKAIIHEIERMTLDEGALFLLRRARVIRSNVSIDTLLPTTIEHAHDICRMLEGLPLALDQAGACIEEMQISLPTYIKHYDQRKAVLLKRRGKFATDHIQSVATTFSLCLEKVKQKNAIALEFLQMCAFFHPDAIPTQLLAAVAPDVKASLQIVLTDEWELNTLLETLLNLSLLQRNLDRETISMSRLVQVVLLDEMDEAMQRFWAERTIKALCRIFPLPEFEVWTVCEHYLPHAHVAANLIEQWSFTFLEAVQLLYRSGRYHYERAQYEDARRLCEQALSIDEQLSGNEHSETAHILRVLGGIYQSQKDYERAQHYYERALASAEHLWGPDHREIARILNQTGELFQTLDQVSLAEHYYQRALVMREKIFGLDHYDTAASLNNMAGIREEQKKYGEAEAFYEQALRIRESLRSPQHPDIAESLSNIARFYRVIGRYSQALPLYERSIIACEQAFGPEHPRFAISLNNFGFFCITLGRYEQAEHLLKHALKIREQLFGQDHPIPAGSWNHLARVYSKQGHYKDARELFEKALYICERDLGKEHSTTTLIRTNIGEMYLLQGDNTRAEDLLAEILADITKGQDPRSVDAAPVLQLLGKVYLAQAKTDQAEPFLTEALTIRQEILGNMHPETGLTLKSLGDLSIARNSETQAQLLYQQALSILLEPLGVEHPEVSELLTSYARLLRKMGKEDEAQTLPGSPIQHP